MVPQGAKLSLEPTIDNFKKKEIPPDPPKYGKKHEKQ